MWESYPLWDFSLNSPSKAKYMEYEFSKIACKDVELVILVVEEVAQMRLYSLYMFDYM